MKEGKKENEGRKELKKEASEIISGQVRMKSFTLIPPPKVMKHTGEAEAYVMKHRKIASFHRPSFLITVELMYYKMYNNG